MHAIDLRCTYIRVKKLLLANKKKNHPPFFNKTLQNYLINNAAAVAILDLLDGVIENSVAANTFADSQAGLPPVVDGKKKEKKKEWGIMHFYDFPPHLSHTRTSIYQL